MSFSTFVTEAYRQVKDKHSDTLTDLRKLAVQQLSELSVRRVGFMQGSAEFTVLEREPYNGEWAGPGLPGFPLNIREIDHVYYAVSNDTGWDEIEGPVPIREIRLYQPPLTRSPSPFELYPYKWAWWEGKLWLNRLGEDRDLRIDYWKDGVRDEKTGVKIATDSTVETNGWLERGETALLYAVLAAYYALPASKDEAVSGLMAAQREYYLAQLENEALMREQSAHLQAPICL